MKFFICNKVSPTSQRTLTMFLEVVALCGWGSIPGKNCSFLIVFLSKGLSLYFMCSDQHVKYQMPRGFPLTSSLLLDYDIRFTSYQYCKVLISKLASDPILKGRSD